MNNLQRTYSIGEVEIDGSAIYHKTEYRERRNHYTLFACTRPVDGYDTSRDAFVGIHEGLHDPKVPFAGKCTNSKAFGWNPIGAHQINLNLAPGQEETFSFVLAYVDQGKEPKFDKLYVMNKKVGKAIVAKYGKPGAVDAAFANLNKVWGDLLSNFQAQSPDPHANRMLNVWNQYQCMATFNMSRSASMYETGIGRGMGYRDSNQDLLGFVHMIPSRARERILDIAATQLSDGTCYHQYQPLTKKGNAEIGGDFYDDHLWLILSTCQYIKETGDLEHSVGAVRVRGQAGRQDGSAAPPGSQHRVHDEQARAARAAADRARGLERLPEPELLFDGAERELPVRGRRQGQQRRERDDRGAVPVREPRDGGALRFHGQGRRTRPACARATTTMLDIIEKQAWDGEWYRRAYDAAGKPVGSKECEEGKIFIEITRLVRAGRGGTEQRPRQASDGERAQAPLHQERRDAAAAGVLGVSRRVRRGDQLPAGGEGKRRHLLPQQHLDQSRLVPAGRRRPGAGVLPVNLPLRQRRPN